MDGTLKRPSEKCCEGVGLECFGCNPTLLAQGEKCEDQTTNSAYEERSLLRNFKFELIKLEVTLNQFAILEPILLTDFF